MLIIYGDCIINVGLSAGIFNRIIITWLVYIHTASSFYILLYSLECSVVSNFTYKLSFYIWLATCMCSDSDHGWIVNHIITQLSSQEIPHVSSQSSHWSSCSGIVLLIHAAISMGPALYSSSIWLVLFTESKRFTARPAARGSKCRDVGMLQLTAGIDGSNVSSCRSGTSKHWLNLHQ